MNDVTKNKDLARSFINALNERNVEAAVAGLAEDFVNHGALPGAQGRDAVPRLVGMLWKAMPDLKYRIDDVIAEGDRVVCRVTMTGTHTGPFEFKHMPFPATGREVVTEQIHVFRIANGKAVEHWLGRDDIGMFRQLGVGPFAGSRS
jgi:steroid delta-isomerase-like uncharacterized protein